MDLYLAGIYTANFDIGGSLYQRLTENEKYHRESVRHLLESYHYVHRQSSVDRMRKDKVQVFLDSGAFSAFTKGVEVDLPAYCDYIKRNRDIIRMDGDDLLASVLDGIGDPLKTWQNQQAMEKLGVRPLPCFHYGEDERYLEWYIANYEYITIGGMVPISTRDLFVWLDRIWGKYLTDGSGKARLKVHGFGLTTPSLMERYPWYSVDSSSWVQIARVGGVFLHNNAKVVSMSSQAPQRKVDMQHFDNFPPIMRKAIIDEIESNGGDVSRLREQYLARWTYNIYSFGELNHRYNSKTSTFHIDQEGLF